MYPFEEAEHEQHSHRVVEAGLALQGEPDPAPQRRAAQESEHRGAVRGGEDGAQQQTVQQRQSEESGRSQPRDECRDDGAAEREAERRAHHVPQLLERGAQPSVEQDQRERDCSDSAGQRIVIELDPGRAVGPHRHSNAQEQQQRGNAKPRRGQGGAERSHEQRSDNEDELAVRHGQTFRISSPAATGRVCSVLGARGRVL